MLTPHEGINQADRDFLSWMMSQPKNRPITHEMGWCECAVGDYSVEKFGDVWEFRITDSELTEFLGESDDPLGETYGETVEALHREGFYKS